MLEIFERDEGRPGGDGVLKAHAALPARDIYVALPGMGSILPARGEDGGDEMYRKRNLLLDLLGKAEHLSLERTALFAAVHIFVDVPVKFVVRPGAAVALFVALGDVVFQSLRSKRRDLPARDAPRADAVAADELRNGRDALARDERLTDAHRRVGVVHRAVRRELHPELLRHRTQSELAGETLLHVHVKELRIVKFESEGRELVAVRLQIEIIDVVEGRVTQDDMFLIFEERLDAVVHRGKGGIFFEILVHVREHQPFPPLAVGEVEFPFGIEQDVLPFQNVEPLVGEHIPEGADLGDALEHAGAFDIEKDVPHYLRGTSFSVPPI